MWPTGSWALRTLGVVRAPNWFRKFRKFTTHRELTEQVGYTCDPCGWLTSVCSVKRAPYGPMRIPHRLANTHKMSHVGRYGAHWGPWVHVLIIYARPNLSIAIWHVRVRQDCLGAFYGHKLVGSLCLNIMHVQLPATAILHPYGFKNLKK